MKTQTRMRMVMAVLTLALLAGGEAGAQTVCTWNNTSGGNWSATGNPAGWTPQVPDLAGDTADVSTLAVGGTITIDAFTPRTVGVLKAGDTTTAYAGWTFNGPGYLSVANGGCLIMNNSGAGAQINRPIAADTATLALNMPALLLNDNLTFNLSGGGPITVGNVNTVVKAVSGSRTLTVASASTGGVTINSAITDGGGAVALVQNSSGSGALTLANDNTYGGGTTLSAGTLTISSGIPNTMSALGTGLLTINGGTLSFNGYTITNAITFPANFNFTAGGALTTVLAGPITPLTGNLTLTASGSSQMLKIASPIGQNGGSYGVSAVSDRIQLMLTGTHTYSGPTSVATAPGTAVLRLGDGVTDGMVGGNIDCGSFNVLYWTVTGNLTYGGSKVILAPYNNAQQFFKEGSGTLTFNGTAAQNWASYSTIQDGTLVVDFSNSSVNDLIGSKMYMQGGTLSVKGQNGQTRSQSLTGGVRLLAAATGAFGLTLNNNGGTLTVSLPASITRDANTVLNIDLSAGGTLNRATTETMGYATVTDGSGVGFARANGSSIVRLTGQGALANNSSASGTDFVTSGTLTHDNGPWAVNSLVLDATGGNGLLDLGDATSIVTDTQLGLLMIGGNNYTVQDGQWGAANSEVIVHTMGSGILTMNSAVSSGTGSLTKNGSGVLVLGNANAYTGATVIHGGTLRLGASGVISDSSTVTVTRNGTLDVNGQTETIAGLLGGASKTLYFGGIVDNSTGTGSLTVNPGANGVFGGVIKNTGGTLALTKAGSFTLTLTGNNTYTGGTTINGGTLKVGDGTLTGDGSIVGNVSVGATYTLEFSNYDAKTYAGSISGTGNLVLDPKGTGALTLSGNSSSFSGPITFWPNGSYPPQLNINHDNALGTGTFTIKSTSSVLQPQRLGNTSGGKRTISNPVTHDNLTGSPSVRFVGPDELELAGTVTWPGNYDWYWYVDAGRKLTLSGALGTTSRALIKRGEGTLVLTSSASSISQYSTVTSSRPALSVV